MDIFDYTLNTIFAFLAVQTFFLFFFARSSDKADRFFSLVIFSALPFMLFSWMEFFLPEESPIFYVLSIFQLQFVSAPALYLYIQLKTSAAALTRKSFLLFLPALIFFIFNIIDFLFFDLFMIISPLPFIGAELLFTFILIIPTGKLAIQWVRFSGSPLILRIWVSLILIILPVSQLMLFIDVLMIEIGFEFVSEIFSFFGGFLETILLGASAWFILFILGNKEFSNVPLTPIEMKEDQATISKYKNHLLSERELDDFYDKLLSLILTKRVYREPDLKMSTLAEKLLIPSAELSQVINRKTGGNFCQFINDYRLRDAVKMLKNNSESNIIEIAFDCGFNSKTAFNQAFKLKIGQTPTEYRKKIV